MLTALAVPSQYKEGSWPQLFSFFWGWEAGREAGQQVQRQLEDCCQKVRNATFTGGVKTVFPPRKLLVWAERRRKVHLNQSFEIPATATQLKGLVGS